MPKQVTKYQCNFCKKSWMAKSRAVKHEVECYCNPANKSCSTCRWSELAEDYTKWCAYLEKEIFVKGSPILNCPTWKVWLKT